MKTIAFLLGLSLTLPAPAWAAEMENYLGVPALRGREASEIPTVLTDLQAGLEEAGKDRRQLALELLRRIQRTPARKRSLDPSRHKLRGQVEDLLVQAFVSGGVLPSEGGQVFWAVHPLATKIARVINPEQWDELQEPLIRQVVADAEAWQGLPFALSPTALRSALIKLDPDEGKRLFWTEGIPEEDRRALFSEAVERRDPAAYIRRRVEIESRRRHAGPPEGEAISRPLFDRTEKSPLPSRNLQGLLAGLSDGQLSQLHQIASGEAASSQKAMEIIRLLERSQAQPILALADQREIEGNPAGISLFIHLLDLKQPIGHWVSAEASLFGMELPQVLLRMRRFARLLDPADQKEISFIFQQVMIRTAYVISAQRLTTIRRIYVRLFSAAFPVKKIVAACPGWLPEELIPELKKAERKEGTYSLAAVEEEIARSLRAGTLRRPDSPPLLSEPLQKIYRLASSIRPTPRLLAHLPPPSSGWDDFQIELLQEMWESLQGGQAGPSAGAPDESARGLRAGLEERGALGAELLRYYRMVLDGVKPAPADEDYAPGGRYPLKRLGTWDDLLKDQNLLSLGPRQSLGILEEPGTARRLALVKADEAARVVQDADDPLPVVSPGHYICTVCIVRGWDPALKKQVILQWHFFPSSSRLHGALAQEPLRRFLPRLLEGLQEIRILLSPEQDPRWKIEEDPAWAPSALREEWNSRLSLPEGAAGILSVTVAPHSFEAGVTTIATEEAAGLFLHGSSQTVLERFSAAQAAVTNPALFLVWPWDRMTDEILPVLRIPAWLAGSLTRYDVTGTGLEEAMGMAEALSVEQAA